MQGPLHFGLVCHHLGCHVSILHSPLWVQILSRNATWGEDCGLLWKGVVCKVCLYKGCLGLFPGTYSILSTIICRCMCVLVLIGGGSRRISLHQFHVFWGCILGGLVVVDPLEVICTCLDGIWMVMSWSILATSGSHALIDQSQVGVPSFQMVLGGCVGVWVVGGLVYWLLALVG